MGVILCFSMSILKIFFIQLLECYGSNSIFAYVICYFLGIQKNGTEAQNQMRPPLFHFSYFNFTFTGLWSDKNMPSMSRSNILFSKTFNSGETMI